MKPTESDLPFGHFYCDRFHLLNRFNSLAFNVDIKHISDQ